MESDAPWNPLGVLFSMYGSRTNSKLLFKYPFKTKGLSSSRLHYQQLSSSTYHLHNPTALNSRVPDVREDDDSAGMDEMHDFMDQYLSFSDETLGPILSPGNTKICGQNFDVKINGLRFVGFPIMPEKSNLDCNRLRPLRFSVGSTGEERSGLTSAPAKVAKTVFSFNVVFVIKTNAHYAIIESFQQLSAKIGLALRFEEQRDNYVTKETKLMLNIHEEAETCLEDVYSLIARKSSFAKDLISIFHSLVDTGIVNFYLNGNISITFCVYHKIHGAENATGSTGQVGIAAVESSLNNIQPYHGILVYDVKDVLESLSPASSSTIVKFLNVYHPSKSLQVISIDADIALTHVYTIARHLMHWGKACVIYPLCETNVYALAPTASLTLLSKSFETFQKTFQVSLIQVLSSFSQPVRLGDLQSPTGPFFGFEHRLVEIVHWLLRNRFLVQHHTYVYFMPSLPESVTYDSVLTNLLNCAARSSDADLARFDRLPKLGQVALQCIHASSNPKDLTLFLKLLPFMDGKHHFEEMMYRSNLMRSDLVTILEKFKPVLLTCVREDEIASVFSSGP